MRHLPASRDQVDLVERELTGLAVRSSLIYLAGVSALFGVMFPSMVPGISGATMAGVELMIAGMVLVFTMLLFLMVFLRFRRAVDIASRSLEKSAGTAVRVRFVRSYMGFNARIAQMEVQSDEVVRREYALVCPAPSSLRAVESIDGATDALLVSDPTSGKPAAVLLPGEHPGQGRVVVICPVSNREAALHMTGAAGVKVMLAVLAAVFVFNQLIPAGIKIGNLPLGFVAGILGVTIAMAVLQGRQLRRLNGTDSTLIPGKASRERLRG